MRELEALETLAGALGIQTRYTDGLGNHVHVGPDTLVRVCAALGAHVSDPGDAVEALKAHDTQRSTDLFPPVLVAWDGVLQPLPIPAQDGLEGALLLEDGEVLPFRLIDGEISGVPPLPIGYHKISVTESNTESICTVISAPLQTWRRPGSKRSWGVAAHLAALRSGRSRSMGDLRDLESLCHWMRDRGGDLVSVLPLLPTFNSEPAEPSPYSPVSRLFWSELILDLEDAHRPVSPPARLDVTAADAEVRKALAGATLPDPSTLDPELVRYARFRGAQARLGRNWREWPAEAQAGDLSPNHVDAEEERFHQAAQLRARTQLTQLRDRLDARGLRLGLDLAVGVHPDGYDPWSRQGLFAEEMSMGAPPDPGFPSGQDWGFAPVLPRASRREGHQYLAASIAHQGALAGVLRIDHVMAFSRLYWIPRGFGLDQGTYVSYPAEEIFAVLTLESHRNRFEVVGENLGTVPPEIDEALPRHGIWGTYVAQFHSISGSGLTPPTSREVAQFGTHDTPTFSGWLDGEDLEERVRCGLLDDQAAPPEREERQEAIRRLAELLGQSPDEPLEFLAVILEWLGRSESPLVSVWLEDLWLETDGVNLPGTSSSKRPNWQRPMGKLLEEIFSDPEIDRLTRCLHRARHAE